MAAKILALVEHRGNKMADVSREVLQTASTLAVKNGLDFVAAVFGDGLEDMIKELEGFKGEIMYLESEELANYNWERYCSALAKMADEMKPRMILMGHTIQGMDLGPRLAAMLDLPFFPDCIDVALEDGKPVVTRELYKGKVRAELTSLPGPATVITIRPGDFPPGDENAAKPSLRKRRISFEGESFLTEFIGLKEPDPSGIDIGKADLVIGVGRGFGDKEKLKVAEDLAKAGGAVLAASRPVIDGGWLPKDRQVGQSGKTIRPKLYIACGISGAHQHVLGMKKADIIVAINSDPKAPIFRIAHYGIVGDIFEVLPALTRCLQSGS